MSFPRYPAYKNSGVEWLGEVPEHWEVRALKWIADLRSGDTIGPESITDEGVYPVFGGNGMRGYTSAFTHEGLFALVGRQGALCGNVNYAEGKFWASEHAIVATPLDGALTGWFGELLRAMNLGQYSVSAAQPGLSVDALRRLRAPLPPVEEQAAIATFLDRETAKIDALVAEQERLIALLQEKRQAVISHAVTKGLDPDVPMKDSGVEWLGEVPAHWDVRAFRRCVEVEEGHVDPEQAPYDQMVLIAPNHVQSGTGRLLAMETAAEQGAESGKYLCRAGDVVYSKIRPALRKVCVAPEPCLCSADMYPLRAHSGLGNRHLLWFMLSECFSAWAVLESQRVAMPKINRESLAEVVVTLPPVLEQTAIATFLDRETAKIDALVEEADRTIDLLKERRSAVISAAVTGQFDVRSAISVPA